MIVSHQHRFIFIKTRKTAGTSIEVFLARIAGPDAIVTPVGPPVPGHEPRNFDAPYNRTRELIRTRGNRARMPARHREMSYFNHMPALLIRERLGVKKWNSYYKFCFERDPWEKVVSYFHFAADRSDRDFRDYVLHGNLPTDFDRYALRDRIAVDFVGQHYDLEADLGRALGEIGVDTPLTLTREKGGLRPESATVDAVFTEELDARVASVFRREIAAFGYDDRSGRG